MQDSESGSHIQSVSDGLTVIAVGDYLDIHKGEHRGWSGEVLQIEDQGRDWKFVIYASFQNSEVKCPQYRVFFPKYEKFSSKLSVRPPLVHQDQPTFTVSQLFESPPEE